MGTKHYPNAIAAPAVTVAGSPATTIAAAKAATLVPINTFYERSNEIYPAPGGHLTTDAGIANGIPSPTTGLRWVPWNEIDDDGRYIFNYQGCNPQTAPIPILVTANAALAGATAMANHTGPRNYGFGELSSDRINGTQNIRFETDSLRVIPVWVNYNSYHGSTYHDMHMQVEGGNGRYQHLSNGSANNGLPRTATTGGGVKRRELTYADRRMKKHRVILSGYGHFMGVYVDTNATIRRTANKVHFMGGIDSWWEPNGAAWDTTYTGGTPSWAPPGTSYQCIGMPEAISFITGLPCGTHSQGGTGWKSANSNTPGEDPAYTAVGTSSCQATDARMLDLVVNFGSQYPIHLLPSSWNDGPSLGTPYDTTYQARMAVGLSKMIAFSSILGRDIKFITGTIQPVDRTNGDSRDVSDVGVLGIPALYPNNCLGLYRLRSMWKDTSSGAARAIYCHPQPFNAYIHLWTGGFMSVAEYIMEQVGAMSVPLDYAQKAIAA